ncbi:unnamed protein product, partial [Amoebophrya sp. A25]
LHWRSCVSQKTAYLPTISIFYIGSFECHTKHVCSFRSICTVLRDTLFKAFLVCFRATMLQFFRSVR